MGKSPGDFLSLNEKDTRELNTNLSAFLLDFKKSVVRKKSTLKKFKLSEKQKGKIKEAIDYQLNSLLRKSSTSLTSTCKKPIKTGKIRRSVKIRGGMESFLQDKYLKYNEKNDNERKLVKQEGHMFIRQLREIQDKRKRKYQGKILDSTKYGLDWADTNPKTLLSFIVFACMQLVYLLFGSNEMNGLTGPFDFYGGIVTSAMNNLASSFSILTIMGLLCLIMYFGKPMVKLVFNVFIAVSNTIVETSEVSEESLIKFVQKENLTALFSKLSRNALNCGKNSFKMICLTYTRLTEKEEEVRHYDDRQLSDFGDEFRDARIISNNENNNFVYESESNYSDKSSNNESCTSRFCLRSNKLRNVDYYDPRTEQVVRSPNPKKDIIGFHDKKSVRKSTIRQRLSYNRRGNNKTTGKKQTAKKNNNRRGNNKTTGKKQTAKKNRNKSVKNK
jgi:hypothetical protein